MKKYLVFAWNIDYPSGGLNDLQGHHNSLYDAEVQFAELEDSWDNVMIVDRDTLEPIHEKEDEVDFEALPEATRYFV